MKWPLVYISLMFLILFPKEATVSVLPEAVPLETVVKNSHYIVLVQKIDPFVKIEKIPLQHAKGPGPYYERKSYQCKVIEILYSLDKKRQPKTGEIIHVYEPGTDERLKDLNRAAQSLPQEKWPIAIEPYFHEDTPANNEDPRIILFLTMTFKEHFELTVRGGYELEPKIGQVRKIIATGQ